MAARTGGADDDDLGLGVGPDLDVADATRRVSRSATAFLTLRAIERVRDA